MSVFEKKPEQKPEQKPGTEVKQMPKEEEGYKKITAQELHMSLNPEEAEKAAERAAIEEYRRTGVMPKGYIHLAQPDPKPASRIIRLFTFITSNWDLVSLAVLCSCVFSLGYLARCLQDGLTSDQIRIGIEAFLEILFAVIATILAILGKLLTDRGAVASSFCKYYKSFSDKLSARKKKIESEEITPWGFSQPIVKRKK